MSTSLTIMSRDRWKSSGALCLHFVCHNRIAVPNPNISEIAGLQDATLRVVLGTKSTPR